MLNANSTAVIDNRYREPREDRREGPGGHLDARARIGVRPGAGHDEHEAGHGAHDERVDEGLEQGDHALAHGFVGDGGGVDDGGRAGAGLVAEGRASGSPGSARRRSRRSPRFDQEKAELTMVARPGSDRSA